MTREEIIAIEDKVIATTKRLNEIRLDQFLNISDRDYIGTLVINIHKLMEECQATSDELRKLFYLQ